LDGSLTKIENLKRINEEQLEMINQMEKEVTSSKQDISHSNEDADSKELGSNLFEQTVGFKGKF
jgi:hypothetical protein